MSEKLVFDYYYGKEAEQFSFYRIPRMLIKDERFSRLSNDSKILYGLMLDRMSLSVRNRWQDDKDRTYIIYTVDEVMEDLNCSRTKAVKSLAELDSATGIGLIEKVRRGLGLPDIIYVKNFVGVEIYSDNEAEYGGESGQKPRKTPEVQKMDFKKSKKWTSGSPENGLQEIQKMDFKKSENDTSRSLENGLQEVHEMDPNYTYINQNNMSQNNTNYNYKRETNPIHPSYQAADSSSEQNRMDTIDGTTAPKTKSVRAEDMREIIRENIEYDVIMSNADENGLKRFSPEACLQRRFEGMYNLICDIVTVPRQWVRINGENYPYEMVRERFLSLRCEHLLYVDRCLEALNVDVKNIRAYLLTALYNAPDTMENYESQDGKKFMREFEEAVCSEDFQKKR